MECRVQSAAAANHEDRQVHGQLGPLEIETRWSSFSLLVAMSHTRTTDYS